MALNGIFQQQTAVFSNGWHIYIDELILNNMKKSLILKAFSYFWEKNGRKLLGFELIYLLYHIVVG